MAPSNEPSFSQRDDAIARLNSDVRLERIRQNASKYDFEHFQQILKRGMKEKKVVVDAEDRADLQKALRMLKGSAEEDSREVGALLGGLAEAIGAELLSPEPGLFEIRSADVSIGVKTNSVYISKCSWSMFGVDAQDSEVLKTLLNTGKWTEAARGLRALVDTVPRDLEPHQKAACYKSLNVLESDLVQYGTQSHMSDTQKELIRDCARHSELQPFSFSLQLPPPINDLLDLKHTVRTHTYKAQLEICKDFDVHVLPTESLLRLEDGRLQWTPKPDASVEVPAQFCVRFEPAVCISTDTLQRLQHHKDMSFGIRQTASSAPDLVQKFRFLGGEKDIAKLWTCTPKTIQSYTLDPAKANEEAVVLEHLAFTNPRNLLSILAMIKEELLFNSLFESICMGPTHHSSGTTFVGVKLDPNRNSWDCRIALGRLMATVRISLSGSSFCIGFDVSDGLPVAREMLSKWTTILNGTRSFPILVHYIEEALHSRGFYIGDEVADLLTDSRYGHEDRPSRKTSNESAMSDVVMDDADVKIGEAWLPRSAPSGRVAKPRAMYVMEMDKGAGMSLLASMKEVDEFEELIPPAPVPLRMRNIHSRPSVDVGQRLSRASTTETRQTLDNAYSDLEAIAEMGKFDEPDGSGRSSAAHEMYPSTADTRGYRPAELARLRAAASVSSPDPLQTPMSARQRQMFPQSAYGVFDFNDPVAMQNIMTSRSTEGAGGVQNMTDESETSASASPSMSSPSQSIGGKRRRKTDGSKMRKDESKPRRDSPAGKRSRKSQRNDETSEHNAPYPYAAPQRMQSVELGRDSYVDESRMMYELGMIEESSDEETDPPPPQTLARPLQPPRTQKAADNASSSAQSTAEPSATTVPPLQRSVSMSSAKSSTSATTTPSPAVTPTEAPPLSVPRYSPASTSNDAPSVDAAHAEKAPILKTEAPARGKPTMSRSDSTSSDSSGYEATITKMFSKKSRDERVSTRPSATTDDYLESVSQQSHKNKIRKYSMEASSVRESSAKSEKEGREGARVLDEMRKPKKEPAKERESSKESTRLSGHPPTQPAKRKRSPSGKTRMAKEKSEEPREPSLKIKIKQPTSSASSTASDRASSASVSSTEQRLSAAPPSTHKLSKSAEQRSSSKRPFPARGDEKKPAAKVRKLEGSSSRSKEERKSKRSEPPPTTPPVPLPEFVARPTFASLKNFKIPKVVDDPPKTSQESTSATETAPPSQPTTSGPQQPALAASTRVSRESTHREPPSHGPPSRDALPWSVPHQPSSYGNAPFGGQGAPAPPPDLQRRPIRSILKNSGSSHANYAGGQQPPVHEPGPQVGAFPPGPPGQGPPGSAGFRRKPLLPCPPQSRMPWPQQQPSFGYSPREPRPPYLPPMAGAPHYAPSASERSERPKERTGDSPQSEELQIDEDE